MALPPTTPAAAPLIVAHRGASLAAPENTLAAFQLAWHHGADAIEGDFHLTQDGQIVCIHDRTTARTANANLVVADSTLAELRALDVGAHAGKQFAGQRIPTLAEVLATVPGRKQVYLEIKCGPEIVPPLVAELRRAGLAPAQVVVISFNAEVLRALKAATTDYRAFWLCEFTRADAGVMGPAPATVLATLRQNRADGLDASRNIPAAVVRALAAAGYEWHAWTVNDPDTARELHRQGARSITTDAPGRLKQELGD